MIVRGQARRHLRAGIVAAIQHITPVCFSRAGAALCVPALVSDCALTACFVRGKSCRMMRRLLQIYERTIWRHGYPLLLR